MNKYYCTVGEKLSKKITPPRNKNIKTPPNNPKTIYIEPTDKIEIEKIIKNMGMKNGGVDKINT